MMVIFRGQKNKRLLKLFVSSAQNKNVEEFWDFNVTFNFSRLVFFVFKYIKISGIRKI